MAQNVLLITIDSLRYNSTCSGEGFGISIPSGNHSSVVSFSHAFATGPGTTPSFPAMLTGTLPLSYGGLGPLSQSRPRLSEDLREFGLKTAAFQCNPFLSQYFNYDIAYDEFKDYQNPLMGVATKVFPRGIEINNPRLRRIDDTLHLTDAIKKTYQLIRGKPRPYVSAEVITDDTIDWLSATDPPFFCWTHYMDVHHPCFPPVKYRERYDVADVTQPEVSEWYSALLRQPEALTEREIEKLRQLYDAAIDYTTDQTDRIIDHLREANRYEDTFVIITSDHGELFGEHDQYGKPERMYDELLRVPLVVVNGPEHLREAEHQLVSLLDIPPLIHDALGLDVPQEYQGQIPGKDEPRENIMAEHEVEGDVIVGARSDSWLYEGDEIQNEHRLFDLRRERFKRVSIHDHPEAGDVQEVVLNRLESLNVESPRLEEHVEPDMQERLEDLGYL